MSNDASLPPLDNPSKWVTGGDAPTDRQKGFIGQLAESTGEDVDPDSLTKGEASLKIDELKKKQDEGVQSDDGPRSKTTGSDKLPSELPADETSPPSDSHLAHPETWTTGGDPATDKQKGFIHVLARQHDTKDPIPEQMSKSEASEMIEKLKRA